MLFLLFIITCVFFTPSAIGFYLRKRNRFAILVLNCSALAPIPVSLLGMLMHGGMVGYVLSIIAMWLIVVSFIFWVVSLVWAVRNL